MPSGVFKVAIIGAGGISGAHSSAAAGSGGRIAVTAVADPSAESRRKLAAAHEGARDYSGVGELLAARRAGAVECDAAVICTPPSVRVKIIESCLKAGLDVLSEKPLAHTLADARKLAAIAKKHPRRRAFVAYCHRFTPAVLKMNELVAAGRIGRVLRFENAFACDLPGHKGKWFSDPKKAGGGAYLDMGSHSVDLMHFMVGTGITVGAVFTRGWKGRTETAATVLLRTTKPPKGVKGVKAGVAASIISGWSESSRFTVAMVGDQGTLFYDYERPAELIFRDLAGKAEVSEVEPHDVRFRRQLLAFADACQSGARTGLATFADGLAAAMMFDQAARKAG